MSQLNIQTTMNKLEQLSTKDSTVYMILYNYSSSDYSIIKIMEELDDAYDYICIQEKTTFGKYKCNFKMVRVYIDDDLIVSDDETMYIACVINGGHHHYRMSEYNNVSSYIIVPMTIC